MSARTPVSGLFRILSLGLALALAPALAGAKEESKIQIRLQSPGGGGIGNGVGQGQVRGDVRTMLQGEQARLQIRVRGLEPETEHVLLAREDEAALESVEIARFTTNGNGTFSGTVDLHRSDATDGQVDPRGRYLVISDGTEDVLAGWLYGAPEDDGPMAKVKELTRLAPDQMIMPSGSVDARCDRRPNGHGTFRIALRGVPAPEAAGEYGLYVDGVEVETLIPNPAGNAKATFTTRPMNGNAASRPHNRKGALGFDPRRKLVELRQGDQVYFSGPMLAQIDGVNVCAASDATTPFVLGPGQVSGSGRVVLGMEADCETSVEVEVEDLPAASYVLYVDGSLVGEIPVTDDGTGNLSGRIDFDPNPDEAGEAPLDFAIGSGSLVEVFAAGQTPDVATPLLTATLP